jgi:tetratricopeptide (TPR) repeat protein
VSVNSPAGAAEGTLRLPSGARGLEARLRQLEAVLPAAGGPPRHVLPQGVADAPPGPAAAGPGGDPPARELGALLFEALLAGEAYALYVASRERAEQRRKGLRLRLCLTPPALAALPWEFLYDRRRGEYLSRSWRTPVVRHLDVVRSAELLPIAPPLRILGMVGKAAEYPLLDAGRERRRIEEALAPLTRQRSAELAWLAGSTRHALQKALRPGRGPWHVLHFVGHGGFDGGPGDGGYLALAAEGGGTERLRAADLGDLLADRSELRLVVLNACLGARGGDGDLFSSTAATLVQRGVEAVVAMQYAITDAAAVGFARAFYEAVAASLPIDAAVSEARKSMPRGSLEWGTPVLYLRAADALLFRPAGGRARETAGGAGPGASAPGEAAAALLEALPLDRVPDAAPLPPRSRMAMGRPPQFVDREAELRALAAAIKAGGAVALTGIGGVGKSQLAAEFVHRYGRYFAGGVFWLSFAAAAGVPAEVAACGGAGALDLRPAFETLPLEDQVRLVRTAWQDGAPRLLVFDTCEDPTLLTEYWPALGSCRVLVTSRRAEWDPALGIRPLALGVLPRPASVALLRAHRPDLEETDPAVDAIADELGDLPLALRLAGSVLFRYRDDLTPASFLAQLRRPDLLQSPFLREPGPAPAGAIEAGSRDVARTFALSYERLNDADPTDVLTRALLARAAHFASGEPIPRDLLLATLPLPAGGQVTGLRAADAVARAIALGLLERVEHEAGGALRLHRLVAVFLQTVVADSASQAAVEEVVLETARRLNRGGSPGPLLSLQPHLRRVTEVALRRAEGHPPHAPVAADAGPSPTRGAQEDRARAASLGNALGYHLWLGGDYAGARPYYERALATRERALGPDHPDTAVSVNDVAGVLWMQGDYAGARPYYERALATRERALGPDHPDTATSRDALAGCLWAQGDYAGARPYYERALATRERALGPDHPDTATSRDNLGVLLRDLGEFEAARAAHGRALAVRRERLGDDHPDTAISVYNLGVLLRDLGEFEAARAHQERALATRERALGPDHPDTAESLHHFGLLLTSELDFDGALQCLKRALAIRERALGVDHHKTGSTLNSLANLYVLMGDLAGAQPYYERALTICKRRLGEHHPETAISLNSFGWFLAIRRDYAGALPYLEQALGIRQTVLGGEHPDIACTLNNLGDVHCGLGRFPQARSHFERALVICRRKLSPDHPLTRVTEAHLSDLTRIVQGAQATREPAGATECTP